MMLNSPAHQFVDLTLQARPGVQPVVEDMVRGLRGGVEPHPRRERGEVRELARVASRPALRQPLPQGPLVRPHPDQAHVAAAEQASPPAPGACVVNLLGERRHQQHRAAMVPDLARGGRHPAVLVNLYVLVVPGALALARVAAGRGQRGGQERPVHRVLVEHGRGRIERHRKQAGGRGLAGPGRARDDPRGRRPVHAQRGYRPGPLA
jgi:hypothetical protein